MDGLDLKPRSAAWARNPEPSLPPLDPQTILDTDEIVYLWNTHAEAEEWLYYDGEPADVIA